MTGAGASGGSGGPGGEEPLFPSSIRVLVDESPEAAMSDVGEISAN